MNTLLALETSTRACSVALWHDGRLHAHTEMTPQAHARHLLPMIDSLLREAGLSGGDVDGLLVGGGPGAFTGLRIAMAVAQGLALGWGCPVATVSALEAMARHHSLGHDAPVLAALDARMGECYAAIFKRGEALMKAALLKPDTLVERCRQEAVGPGCGDAGQAHPVLIEAVDEWMDELPQAAHLIEWARAESVSFHTLDEQVPVPLYLRNDVADKPKGGAV